MPAFVFHTLRSGRQVRASDGLLAGSFARESPLCFWTITVWKDEKSMKAFRNSDAHLKAMPHLAHWCDEASYVHWEQESESVPSAEIVFQRLGDTGKLSKVRHPSAAHAGGAKTGTHPPKLVGAFGPKRTASMRGN